MYVRQHYNLATSGKLGQKASGKGMPKSGGKSAKSGSRSMKKSGGYGSSGKKHSY